METAQRGQANVAAQTGQPFEVTSSRWGLANWVSDLPGFTAPAELQYMSWHFRRTFGALHTADSLRHGNNFPLAYPLVPVVSRADAVSLRGTLKAGSGAYVRVMQPPGEAAFSLRFAGPGGGSLPASVVPRLNILRIR